MWNEPEAKGSLNHHNKNGILQGVSPLKINGWPYITHNSWPEVMTGSNYVRKVNEQYCHVPQNYLQGDFERCTLTTFDSAPVSKRCLVFFGCSEAALVSILILSKNESTWQTHRELLSSSAAPIEHSSVFQQIVLFLWHTVLSTVFSRSRQISVKKLWLYTTCTAPSGR